MWNSTDEIFMSTSEVFSACAPYSGIIKVEKGRNIYKSEFNQLNSWNTKLYIYTCGQNILEWTHLQNNPVGKHGAFSLSLSLSLARARTHTIQIPTHL